MKIKRYYQNGRICPSHRGSIIIAIESDHEERFLHAFCDRKIVEQSGFSQSEMKRGLQVVVDMVDTGTKCHVDTIRKLGNTWSPRFRREVTKRAGSLCVVTVQGDGITVHEVRRGGLNGELVIVLSCIKEAKEVLWSQRPCW